MRRSLLLLGLAALSACGGAVVPAPQVAPRPLPTPLTPAQFWNSATVYFLLTDRFANGDPSNDQAHGRLRDAAPLRGFEGGDLKGLLARITSGYFEALGVNVLWLTPFVEQNRGATDEGTGRSYGYHGYWARDWTVVDPALGNEADLRAVVDAAHAKGMKVLMDAVIQHTGPAIPSDPVWPAEWVRTEPNCVYRSYVTTVSCTLVANLSDIRTESNQPVSLPRHLIEKWRAEERLAKETDELNAWFARTGYPRAPRFYLIKWLTDWVREYGIDGYRVDTAKHFEESVSAELKVEAERALADWRRANPEKVRSTLPFYMVGEVYDYTPENGRLYNFGDKQVDFFAFGYDALINFAFKRFAAISTDSLFAFQAGVLAGPLNSVSLLNYLTSHDDGAPYDRERKDSFIAAVRLLLAPGGAQIYYGDEVARPLTVAGAIGDANLRSTMVWSDTTAQRQLLAHWRRIGQFRHAHPAIGAGDHRVLQASPYVFSRTLGADRVVVALGQGGGARSIPVTGVFAEGTPVVDAYSGALGVVRNGVVTFAGGEDVVLVSDR